LQFGVIARFKTIGGNFQQFINLKDIDACAVINNVEKFPLYKGSVQFLNSTFPGLLHKCPYTVRKLYLKEIENFVQNKSKTNLSSFESPMRRLLT
jgi:hypothetical protein